MRKGAERSSLDGATPSLTPLVFRECPTATHSNMCAANTPYSAPTSSAEQPVLPSGKVMDAPSSEAEGAPKVEGEKKAEILSQVSDRCAPV